MKINKNEVVEASGDMKSVFDRLLNMFSKFLENLGKGGENNIQRFAILPSSYVDNEGVTEDPKTWPYRLKLEYQKDVNPEDIEDSDYTGRVCEFKISIGRAGESAVIDDLVTLRTGDNKSYEDDLIEAVREILTDSKTANKFKDKSLKDAGIEDVQPIKASQIFKPTFRKITSSDSIDVQLVSVTGSSSAELVKSSIDEILDDEEFIEQLPENNDVSYEITVYDDAYDVEELPEVDSCPDMEGPFHNILQKLYQLKLTAEYVAIVCSGPNCNQISAVASSVNWECDEEIRWFQKTSLRYCGAFNPIYLIQTLSPATLQKPTIVDVNNIITDLINTLDLYWCDFDRYDQQTITSYINNWRVHIGLDISKMTDQL